MKTLVIGGLGFIGSNLCQRLIKKGHEVICIDNLSTGSKENVLEFMYDPKFHLNFHDIAEPFSTANVDVVIHCAIPNQRDPLHFMKTCTYGAFNAAGMTRRNKARLIYLSSYAYYGVFNGEQIKESSPSVNINNMICSGIQSSEYILRNYDLDIRVLRIFDTYGKKMPMNSRLYGIIQKMKKDIDVQVNHKDDLVSICNIEDTLDAICCSMEIESFEGPLNIGNNVYISMERIFNILKGLLGSKSKLVNLYDESTFENCIPDIEKAKEVLKWEPKVFLEDGLAELIKFLEEKGL